MRHLTFTCADPDGAGQAAMPRDAAGAGDDDDGQLLYPDGMEFKVTYVRIQS